MTNNFKYVFEMTLSNGTYTWTFAHEKDALKLCVLISGYENNNTNHASTGYNDTLLKNNIIMNDI
jgi:hypothetical protein